MNPVNIAPGDEKHITVAELKGLVNTTDMAREPDRKFFLSYDFNPVNSWHFHDPEHYPLFGGTITTTTQKETNEAFYNSHYLLKILVQKDHRLYTPQINHISLKMPPSPPLSQYRDLPAGVLCNESTVANCEKEFCDCTYTLEIPLGSLVELILIDEGMSKRRHPKSCFDSTKTTLCNRGNVRRHTSVPHSRIGFSRRRHGASRQERNGGSYQANGSERAHQEKFNRRST